MHNPWYTWSFCPLACELEAGALLLRRCGRLQKKNGSLTPHCHSESGSFMWPRLGGWCSVPNNSWSCICHVSWARHTMLCDQLPLFTLGPSQPSGRAAASRSPVLRRGASDVDVRQSRHRRTPSALGRPGKGLPAPRAAKWSRQSVVASSLFALGGSSG